MGTYVYALRKLADFDVYARRCGGDIHALGISLLHATMFPMGGV
jgi:hypothetical protein